MKEEVIKRVVDGISDLPTLPMVLVKTVQMFDDPSTSAEASSNSFPQCIWLMLSSKEWGSVIQVMLLSPRYTRGYGMA